MTLPEFHQFVDAHASRFEGVLPETPESLCAAEQALGFALPESLKWLLTQRGYSGACGIDSLEEAIEATLCCRRNARLPERFVILNDWQDAGVVWMDRGITDENGESPIYWGGTHNFLRLGTGEPLDADLDGLCRLSRLGRVPAEGSAGGSLLLARGVRMTSGRGGGDEHCR